MRYPVLKVMYSLYAQLLPWQHTLYVSLNVIRTICAFDCVRSNLTPFCQIRAHIYWENNFTMRKWYAIWNKSQLVNHMQWEKSCSMSQFYALTKLYTMFKKIIHNKNIRGACWFSGRVLDSRLRFRASPKALPCVLEQETLSSAVPTWLKNCWLVCKESKQTK